MSKTNEKIVIACGADERYVPGLVVTIWSICEYASRNTSLIFHVLDTGISERSWKYIRRMVKGVTHINAEIVCHKVNVDVFSDLRSWNGSYATYARLMLQDILADEDFVVYSDVDMLWMRDISELWAMRDEKIPLMATRDGAGFEENICGNLQATLFKTHQIYINPKTYYCAGMLLLNLRYLRDIGFFERVKKCMQDHATVLTCVDQSIYNILIPSPPAKLLHHSWGMLSFVNISKLKEPCVIHYASNAPWTRKTHISHSLWWPVLLRAAVAARWPRKILWARVNALLTRLLSNEMFFEFFYFPFRILSPGRYNHRKKRLFQLDYGERKCIAVTCSANKRYVPGLLTTIYSICTSARPGTHVVVHLLDDGIGFNARRGLVSLALSFRKIQCDIKFHEVDSRLFEKSLPAYNGGYTAYIRLLLQDILLENEFVIYTDVDMVWKRDINELWELRKENVVLQATADTSGYPVPVERVQRMKDFSLQGVVIAPEKYYNTGLMLINLAKLRDENFTEKVKGAATKYASLVSYADQDLYNILLPVPQTVLLPEYWGYFLGAPGQATNKSCVIHFADRAPWICKPFRGAESWWPLFVAATVRARMPWMFLRAFAGTVFQRIVLTRMGFELLYLPFRLLSPSRYRHRKNRMFPLEKEGIE